MIFPERQVGCRKIRPHIGRDFLIEVKIF